MGKKESRRVKTLSGFMKWAEQFDSGQYLFRGVSNEKYEIEASAYRRLGKNSSDPAKLLKINEEVISDARLEGHDQKNGQRLFDLELLAELQHYGAATCLIDFTHSAQVALWMACQRGARGTTDNKTFNGKVFAVRSDDSLRFKKITPESLEKKLDYFFKADEHRRYALYQWQPKQQNNRIISQQSVFLFGGAKIEAEAECVILKSSKETILISLGKSSGITEARMFPDFEGFARLRAHDRQYIESDAQDYLQRGILAHQEGRVNDAIVYYDEAASLQPDNYTLASALYHRARTFLENRDTLDLSIEHLSMAIQLKPDFAEAYYDRGFVYLLDKTEANLANEDFTRLIRLKPDYAEAYYWRGISWLFLQSWEKAKVDLAAAQNRGFDLTYLIHDFYGTLEQFEEHSGIELPEDIVKMLTER
jgi:tetratricopeptide (TPR) repeat protein